MDDMNSIVSNQDKILISQVKEWGEILINFESRNRYRICDEEGEELGFAAEEGGGLGAMLGRNFLGSARACTLHVFDRHGTEVGQGKKPFRWFFYEMVAIENGRLVGRVKRRFAVLNRRFTVYDAEGKELFEIFSPLFRIWTFKVQAGGVEIARINKKWSGLLKEAFSDADNFGVEFFGQQPPADFQKLLLFATFLIDFCFFENNNSRH